MDVSAVHGKEKVYGSIPYGGSTRGLHVSVRPIFTFGSDILVRSLVWLWSLPCRAPLCPPGGFLRGRERFPGTLALSGCGVRVLAEVLARVLFPRAGVLAWARAAWWR